MLEAIDGNIRLRVEQDEFGECPREWNNLGTILYNHRNYVVGDVRVNGEKESYRHIGVELGLYEDEFESWDQFVDAVKHQAVILPVYLFDHSGLRMSTLDRNFRAFDAQGWDWGQVGLIYVTLKTLEEEGLQQGKSPEEIRDSAAECLRNEIEVFDQYLSGQVFYFSLAEKEECEHCGNVEWTLLDSCSGFYGQEWKENGMKDHIPEKYRYLLDHLEAKRG